MAEKSRYPQIPATVWWGVRSVLNKTPRATVDERFLSVQLDVQEAAARAYINELVSVGILNEEKRATPLADKWRLDPSYNEAVSELLEQNYPEGLRHVAPPDEGDRQKATQWFQSEGLGQGAAGNKAATYFMIGSASPNESPSRPTKGIANDRSSQNANLKQNVRKIANGQSAKAVTNNPLKDRGQTAIPLNVNVQIHISADAGSEQIEAIFSAMRRYLDDQQDS